MSQEYPERKQISRRALIAGGAGLAGALGLGLVGCGSDSDDEGSQAGTNPGTNPGTSPSTSAAPSGDGATVMWTDWNLLDQEQGLGLAWATVASQWSEQSGTTVQLEGAPFGEYVTAMTTRARAGELGDVVTLLPDAPHGSLFEVMTQVSPDDAGELFTTLSGWGSGVYSLETPDVYAGIPLGVQGSVFYYNKRLFEAAGLDPDLPPDTWADFMAACEALRESGVDPLVMSGVDSFAAWIAWNTLSSEFFTDADVVKIRTGEISATDERFLASLRPLQDTFDRGFWNDDYSALTWADAEARFGAGEAAIFSGIISAAFNWAALDQLDVAGDYGVFTGPLVEGARGKRQFAGATTIMGLSADAPEPELGADLIRYIVSKEGQETGLEIAGNFPNRTDVDVAALTGSDGAAAIQEILSTTDNGNSPLVGFNAAMTEAAYAGLTVALTSGELEGFLRDIAELQEG